jgi:hypothetical protein
MVGRLKSPHYYMTMFDADQIKNAYIDFLQYKLKISKDRYFALGGEDYSIHKLHPEWFLYNYICSTRRTHHLK